MSYPPYYMNRFLKRNRRRAVLLICAALSMLLISSVLTAMDYAKQSEERLSANIAPKVLRFHVLANSDSDTDQQLKMEVKQLLLDTIYQGMKEESGAALEVSSYTKEELRTYILSHQSELEKTAEDYMASKGFSYSADLKMEQCYFPTKTYGDVIFPCGTYDAVRVLLGKGEGRNWWCVLYPPLCFNGTASGEVPDTSKEELKNLLPESDYRELMFHRRVVFGDGTQTPGPVSSEIGLSKSNTPADPASADKNASKQTEVTVHVRFKLAELLGRKN